MVLLLVRSVGGRSRSAGRAESLDPDAIGGYAQVDEQLAGRTREAGGAAHVCDLIVANRAV